MDPAKAGAAVPPPANLYGLGSLVGDYGDDDNENEDAAGILFKSSNLLGLLELIFSMSNP